VKSSILNETPRSFYWFLLNRKQLQILAKIEAQVKKAMSGEASGHDWWHVARVAANAARIAKAEPKADPFIVPPRRCCTT